MNTRLLNLRVTRIGSYVRSGETHFVIEGFQGSKVVRLNIAANDCVPQVCEVLAITQKENAIRLEYEVGTGLEFDKVHRYTLAAFKDSLND